MICSQCGTELHEAALHCWRCGAQTPNYTDELKARFQQEERERLQEMALLSPEGMPPSGRMRIKVYRKTWYGKRLAGWLDENGCTYKVDWPSKPLWRPWWSVDEQGHIYVQAGEHRAFFGWLGENGAVYAQYARPSGGFYSYPEAGRIPQPPREFSPDLAFIVKSDGAILRPGRDGTKPIGKIEGAPNLESMAALVLLVLM